MYRKRLILAGVLANILTGCSSPPKLTEPEGQWVDFDTSGRLSVQLQRLLRLP